MTRTLVTGATGRLGRQLVREAERCGHVTCATARRGAVPVDLTTPGAIAELVQRWRPDLILHAAAWTDLDGCEADPHRAHQVNAAATRDLAAAARDVDAHVVYLSTDHVFDGTKATPYVEGDQVSPCSAYGRSKLAGERALHPDDTVVRTSWLSGDRGPNFVLTVLGQADGPGPLQFVDDQIGHPTFVDDLATAVLELGTHRVAGIHHVTNQGAVSRYQFAREVLEAAGQDPDRIEPTSTEELGASGAPRPRNGVLAGPILAASGIAPLRDHREPLAALVARLRPR